MVGFLTYETINPEEPTSKIEILIPKSLVDHWHKTSFVQYQNLLTATAVLDAPKRIFHGTRTINEGGWCYVGKPADWFIKENVRAPFPSDKVFSVYLRENFKLYTFRADYADSVDNLSPKDWENRYGSLKWKSSL